MKKRKGARGWRPEVLGILAPLELQGPEGGCLGSGAGGEGLPPWVRAVSKGRGGAAGDAGWAEGKGAHGLPRRRRLPPSPGWRSLSGSNRRGGRSGQSQRRQSPGRDSQQLWSGPQICSCLLPGRPARPAPPAPRPSASRPRGDTEARKGGDDPGRPEPGLGCGRRLGRPSASPHMPRPHDLWVWGQLSPPQLELRLRPLSTPPNSGLLTARLALNLLFHAEKVKHHFENRGCVGG